MFREQWYLKNDGLITVIKNADTGAVMREARNKANVQVETAKTTSAIRNAVKSTVDKINATDASPTGYADSIKDILTTLAPKNTRIKSALNKFNKYIDERAVKADDSVGSAKRKTTASDVVEDVKHDLDQIHQSVKEAVDDIDATKKAALDSLGDATDATTQTIRNAIEATSMAATRAAEAAGVRKGIKIKRAKLDKESIDKNVRERFDNLDSTVTKRTKRISTILKERGVHIDNANIPAVVKDALKKAGVAIDSTDSLGAQIIQKIKGIGKDHPDSVGTRVQHMRENVTNDLDDLHQRMEDAYVGHPGDATWIEAQQLLKDIKDELESTLDWAGMVNDSLYSDLVKIDPRWSLLSKSYEDSMGKEGRKILQEQYQALSQKLISNQFGSLSESLSSKFVKTQVPLAEWMSLNILELTP